MLRLILSVLLVLGAAAVGYWLISWIVSLLLVLALIVLVSFLLWRRRKR